jgi:hypothetical protein
MLNLRMIILLKSKETGPAIRTLFRIPTFFNLVMGYDSLLSVLNIVLRDDGQQ